MDYPGKVITKTQVTPTQTSASGNWTLDDQAAAIKNNNWPVALVPNPISKSLRFNSADSAYLNRTPASAGNRRTWTWSGWVKRSGLGATEVLLDAGTGPNTFFRFDANQKLAFSDYTSGPTYNIELTTTQVLRDVSAWYHIVVAVDTTQATSTNRVKIYLNGSQITAFSTATYPSQNFDTGWNNATAHRIGSYLNNTNYLNGYLTEVNFIDGQALTPSDFGLTNPQTGQWIPKKYTGTYGTNGFYLNFKDATSTTTLGYDYSGNANNWTTNNFSVTAGSGNDSLTDVPTPWVAYSTTGDVGGVVRGNYCTLNPLFSYTGLLPTNGNLDYVANSANWRTSTSTISMTSGKWYCEFVVNSFSTGGIVLGIVGTTDGPTIREIISIDNTVIGRVGTVGYGYQNNGTKYSGGSSTSYGASYTATDVIGIALDLDAGTIVFYKNGSSQGTAFSSLTGTFGFAASVCTPGTTSVSANFGQRPFAYTPPAGFRSLCTTNLPATTIGFGLTNQGNNYFDATLYTGTGSALSVTNSGSMQPDFVWLKRRSSGNSHGLFDSIRGVNNYLSSETTGAEATIANSMTAFNSNGFSLGTDSTWNLNTSTNVGWQWRAAGSTVSNTAGTITSTVSANTTAGFSIVTYTGNGTNGATVGHGLGVAPSMIIIKVRNAADNWPVYHRSLGNTDAVFLNTTAATQALTYWNSTTPSSTVFTLGSNLIVNKSSDTFVAYCFAAVAGYSAFGSYTGNGSTDGPFIYTGFRPRFVMVKRTDGLNEWLMHDSARSTYNVVNARLSAQSSAAESTSPDALDFTSNGFKLRTTDGGWNASGGTYIYMAFAESPFQFSNAR